MRAQDVGHIVIRVLDGLVYLNCGSLNRGHLYKGEVVSLCSNPLLSHSNHTGLPQKVGGGQSDNNSDWINPVIPVRTNPSFLTFHNSYIE